MLKKQSKTHKPTSMSKSLFRVGQDVVSVEEWEADDSGADKYSGPLPQLGKIYRVRRVVLETSTGDIYLALVGLSEPWFHQEGFAPVEFLPDEALDELLEEVFSLELA